MKKFLFGTMLLFCLAVPYAAQAQAVDHPEQHHRHHHHHHHHHDQHPNQ